MSKVQMLIPTLLLFALVATAQPGDIPPNAEPGKCYAKCLIPAALEGTINSNNAEKVKAKLILEGANGPVTANADKLLQEKGVTIIPDILANGGGVIVSYFEWVQDMSSYFWSEEEVYSKLKTVISTAFEKVWDFSQQRKLDLRTSAWGVSVGRVEKAMLLRGLYPR